MAEKKGSKKVIAADDVPKVVFNLISELKFDEAKKENDKSRRSRCLRQSASLEMDERNGKTCQFKRY